MLPVPLPTPPMETQVHPARQLNEVQSQTPEAAPRPSMESIAFDMNDQDFLAPSEASVSPEPPSPPEAGCLGLLGSLFRNMLWQHSGETRQGAGGNLGSGPSQSAYTIPPRGIGHYDDDEGYWSQSEIGDGDGNSTPSGISQGENKDDRSQESVPVCGGDGLVQLPTNNAETSEEMEGVCLQSHIKPPVAYISLHIQHHPDAPACIPMDDVGSLDVWDPDDDESWGLEDLFQE
ncbi:hypothetical protein QBC40DRAFT_256026 [Triangularia verruculosa]|uniref:Uncharacterized protein n=1 Tax=Triangularia verruculosa TaxID=2587418 RepID=A0AAN6XD18_9PEZI|nr:hypothetical protein QBC40DRAFT_256026 [Triangularia verruculosa]